MVYTTFSVAVYLTAYFVDVGLTSVLVCSLFGYILSLDLAGLGLQFMNFIKNRNRIAADPGDLQIIPNKWQFLWTWGVLEGVFHFVMLAIVGVISGLLNYNSTSFETSVWKNLGYAVIGVCVAEKIFRDSQNVFLIFGLVRNGLYPKSVLSQRTFSNGKRKLKVLGVVRRILVNWGKTLFFLYNSYELLNMRVLIKCKRQ